MRAVQQWKQVVGDAFVATDDFSIEPYRQNVSAISRSVPVVIRPGNTSEVQQLVQIANQFKIPIHPISCGRNWGLGSRLPVRDGTAILDLGRMNRILEVNVRHHYAVVEPGVTQGQLYDYLREHQLPLVLNVTGAGRDTSLIGNALERGIGYFSPRGESLSGLEVVLGNGELLRTGFGHLPQSKITHHYRYGIGPGLDSLFLQSNFGIVTRAGMDLIPQPEEHACLIASLRDGFTLEEFVDRLASLRRAGVVQTVIHIGSRNRTEITLAPLLFEVLREKIQDTKALKSEVNQILVAEGFASWSAVIGLLGPRCSFKSNLKEVKTRLGDLARITFLTETKVQRAKAILNRLSFVPWARRKRAVLGATEPLFQLSRGVPTDAAIGSLYWPIGELPPKGAVEPDQSACGMLYCLPMMPLEGDFAAYAMNHIEKLFEKFQFVPATTLNIIDSRTLEAVISVSFDKRVPRQVELAHQCIDAVERFFIDEGCPPYRVGIQSMGHVVDATNPHWGVVRNLKQVFDPQNLVAPGRYNLI